MKFVLDVDDVLADFMPALCELANEMFGYKLSMNTLKGWAIEDSLKPNETRALWEIVNQPGWQQRFLQPCMGAQEGVKRLQSLGNVHILTAPVKNAPTWCYDRIQWLEQHFGISWDHVTFSTDKSEWGGDMFVDDRIKNLIAWKAKHPERQAVLWGRPYNRQDVSTARAHGIVFAEKWDQLIDLSLP